jgi:hypothetical protein
MGISRDDDVEFPLGSSVVVRRGKHAGGVFAVVGIDDSCGKDGKILIADGRKISAAKPKRKSPRHIELAGGIYREIGERLAEGKTLDDGWLCNIISSSAIENTACS